MLGIEPPREHRIPDVLVGREPKAPAYFPGTAGQGGSTAALEPITVPLVIEEVEIRERWIEIKTLPELDLVTVIEILSPTNKSGEGRMEFLKKRMTLIERPINLVEIDFLLGGHPIPVGRLRP